MSPLALGEILGVSVNTLIADDKYPVKGCENLQLPIQTEWSEKLKTFSRFFVPFLDSTSNFKHFEKNMMVIANVFPKLETVKNFIRALSKKRSFRTRIDSQHLKPSQMVGKSPG